MKASARGRRLRHRMERRADVLAEDLRRDYLRGLDALAQTLTSARVADHLAIGAPLLADEEIRRAFAPWRLRLRSGVEAAGKALAR